MNITLMTSKMIQQFKIKKNTLLSLDAQYMVVAELHLMLFKKMMLNLMNLPEKFIFMKIDYCLNMLM